MREVDLILGRFADASLDGMSEQDLTAFETLLDVPDPLVLAWVTRQEPPPSDSHGALIERLIAFHA